MRDDKQIIFSIASQAAIALTNRQLINQLEELFESFIKLINIAIDDKSPYTGGHHERMDGKGYPRGLTGEQMSLQARMMGIADIFEALTAKDRPYKRGKTLTEALTILGRRKQDHHVDPDLFDLFIREKVYLRYAKAFLEAEQIDEVDDSKLPGYTP